MCKHVPRTVLLSSNGHTEFIRNGPSAYKQLIVFVLESRARWLLRRLITRGSRSWLFQEKKSAGGSRSTIRETLSTCSTVPYREQRENMAWLLFVSTLPIPSHFCFPGKAVYLTIKCTELIRLYEKTNCFPSFTCTLYVVVATAALSPFSGFICSLFLEVTVHFS